MTKIMLNRSLAQIVSFILTTVMILSLLMPMQANMSFAASIDSSQKWFYTLENDKAKIIGTSLTEGDITIPDTVTDENGLSYAVSEIGDNAFQGLQISSATIPNNIELGTGIFSGCNELTSVSLPEGLSNIPSNMFNSCDSLSSINIPDGTSSIGANAFEGCTSLSNTLTLPSSVEQLGSNAFKSSSLTELPISSDKAGIAFAGWYIEADGFGAKVQVSDQQTMTVYSYFSNTSTVQTEPTIVPTTESAITSALDTANNIYEINDDTTTPIEIVNPTVESLLTTQDSVYAVTSDTSIYTITYDTNGGTGIVPIDTKEYKAGDIATILFDPTPTMAGMEFKGWSFRDNALNPDFSTSKAVTYTMSSSSVTLYAVWRIQMLRLLETTGYWSDTSYYDTTIATAAASDLTITDAYQLAGFMMAVNRGESYSGYTVTLGNDIDLSEAYWVPIGTSTARFKGTFNGAGYSITGMSITTSSLQYVGLFGYTDGNAIIKNTEVNGIIDTRLDTADIYAGGLAGYIENTTILSCKSNVLVSTAGIKVNSGGLIGTMDASNAYDSYSIGQVVITSPTNTQIFSGGFSGFITSSKVENCYSTGTVSAVSSDDLRIGGFAGAINAVASLVNHCYSAGKVIVSTPSSYCGAFFGYLWNATVDNSYYLYNAYSDTSTSGYGTKEGGNIYGLTGLTQDQICGYNNIQSTYLTGSNNFVGASLVFALNNNETMYGRKGWSQVIGQYPTISENSGGLWSYAGKFDIALANAPASNITINSASELAGLMAAVNNGTSYLGYTITLGSDIDMSASKWIPIGKSNKPFSGNFNGAGHTITGINISTSSINYVGLFGYVSGGLISNLNTNVNINSIYSPGLLRAGGIAGYAKNTNIKNCSVNANISGTSINAYIGGFIGEYSSDTASIGITSCIVNGSIYVNSSDNGTTMYESKIGGFAGSIYGISTSLANINRCSASTTIRAINSAILMAHFGGLIGSSQYSNIINANQ